MKTLALTLSLLLNLVLGAGLLYVLANGCAEVADGRLGVLKQEVKVGLFGGGPVLFTLPKGLVVMEASATGADRFEPYRFRLVVSSDDPGLVDYAKPTDANPHGEFYSAEVQK